MEDAKAQHKEAESSLREVLPNKQSSKYSSDFEDAELSNNSKSAESDREPIHAEGSLAKDEASETESKFGSKE